MPGDLPLTSEGRWEKVLGVKEVTPPRTVSTPKAHVKTQPQAGGGDETEPSLNNRPVISVQSTEEHAHPTPPFPALQGPYEKGGRGRTWDLQESEGQHKGTSAGKDMAPVLPLQAKVRVPPSAQQPSAKVRQIQAPAAAWGQLHEAREEEEDDAEGWLCLACLYPIQVPAWKVPGAVGEGLTALGVTC